MGFNENELPPPPTPTVVHDHRPVIYTPDGKAYVRQAGFVTGERPMAQTSGVIPQLNSGGKRIGGKKGKKSMCDTYVDDPKLTYGENRILARLECQLNNDQLGHCVVYSREHGWNVPGLHGRSGNGGVKKSKGTK